jgi:hypothetical protein
LSSEIRVFRQSNMPVRVADYTAYQEEFAATSDAIMERAKLNMEKAQRMYRYMERQLLKKYNNEVTISLPVNETDIRQMLLEYGTPVTFAQVQNSEEIVIMLMDEL